MRAGRKPRRRLASAAAAGAARAMRSAIWITRSATPLAPRPLPSARASRSAEAAWHLPANLCALACRHRGQAARPAPLGRLCWLQPVRSGEPAASSGSGLQWRLRGLGGNAVHAARNVHPAAPCCAMLGEAASCAAQGLPGKTCVGAGWEVTVRPALMDWEVAVGLTLSHSGAMQAGVQRCAALHAMSGMAGTWSVLPHRGKLAWKLPLRVLGLRGIAFILYDKLADLFYTGACCLLAEQAAYVVHDMIAPAPLGLEHSLVSKAGKERCARQALFFGLPLRVLRQDTGGYFTELDYREETNEAPAKLGKARALPFKLHVCVQACWRLLLSLTLAAVHQQEQGLAGSLSALPGNGSYASGHAGWSSGGGVKFSASGMCLAGHRRSRELSALASGHSSSSASLELEAASRRAP